MFSLMGNCISCARRKKEPRKELTLAIFGLDDVGKTTITKALLGEELETAPTIGFCNESFTFENFDIKLFDVGGGKKIRDIWKNYYYDSHGIIYVVDSSTAERMEETRDNMKKVLEHSQVSGKPILVLANKQDLPTAMDEVDLCEQLNLENTVNTNKCPCRIEKCSAVKGTGKKIDDGIKDGLRWLCNFILHNWDEISDRVDKDQEQEKKKQQIEAEARKERVRKIREERERKEKEEAEEKRRLGIEVAEESEEEELVGDPFKRLDVNTLTKKELKEKEEKLKRKEFEKLRQNKKLKDNQDSDDADIRAPRSNRSLNRYDLLNGHLRTSKKDTDESQKSDEDTDDFITSPHARRLTPRLPPLQHPIGTKFSANEEGPNTKVKKKTKKKEILRTLNESEDENGDINDHTLRSVSKIDFDARHDNPWSRNSLDRNYRSYRDKSERLDVYQQFENEKISPRAQRKLNSLDGNYEENDMDITPRTRKKKGKKKKFLTNKSTDDRYPLDGSDFTSPRHLGKDMSLDSDDNELNVKSNDIYSISSHKLRTKLPTLDGEDEEERTLKKVKKKKTYLKKNKTAPSDDELENRNSSYELKAKRDYSWTQSLQKENGLFGGGLKFVEDLPEVDSDSDMTVIRRRPNLESDDDIIT